MTRTLNYVEIADLFDNELRPHMFKLEGGLNEKNVRFHQVERKF